MPDRPHALVRPGLCFCLALFFAYAPHAARAQAPAELLEIGAASRPRAAAPAPGSIKIVSYNIRWRGGEDLRRLISLLRDDAEIGGASIIGLQEVDRNKKRTKLVNTAGLIAEELGMHYAWAAPPVVEKDGKKQPEEETGVAILSPYPLTEVRRVVLPHEGPGGRRRAAVGATVRIGDRSVRVYSVHAETRISTERKIEQLRAVLQDLDAGERTERAVVLGDFNTIGGDSIRRATELFTAANFTTPFPESEDTWKTFVLTLKLDWMWLRSLRPTRHGIDRKIGLSDHWPLWAVVKL